ASHEVHLGLLELRIESLRRARRSAQSYLGSRVQTCSRSATPEPKSFLCAKSPVDVRGRRRGELFLAPKPSPPNGLVVSRPLMEDNPHVRGIAESSCVPVESRLCLDGFQITRFEFCFQIIRRFRL